MKRILKVGLSLLAVVACGLAGVFGADFWFSRSSEAAPDQAGRGGSATRVGVSDVVVRDLAEAVTAVGTVEPLRTVDLSSSVSGQVVEVAVTSGQRLSSGDTVLQLAAEAQRAALTEAEATLSETRQERDRLEELQASNTAAEQQVEQARAAFQRAQAGVATAQESLEDRTIVAPFDGTLGLIDIEVGSYVDPSSTIVQLSDLTAVKVDFSLAEEYYSEVSSGQAVEVTTPSYPEQTFEGEVTVLAPQVRSGSRSFTVRARIETPERRLAGGMFADTRLVLGRYEGLVIPDDAIISEGLTSYVFKVQDGTAVRQNVTPGQSAGSATEIVEGLSAEDRIVVAGWDGLSDGDEVQISEDVARDGLE